MSRNTRSTPQRASRSPIRRADNAIYSLRTADGDLLVQRQALLDAVEAVPTPVSPARNSSRRRSGESSPPGYTPTSPPARHSSRRRSGESSPPGYTPTSPTYGTMPPPYPMPAFGGLERRLEDAVEAVPTRVSPARNSSRRRSGESSPYYTPTSPTPMAYGPMPPPYPTPAFNGPERRIESLFRLLGRETRSATPEPHRVAAAATMGSTPTLPAHSPPPANPRVTGNFFDLPQDFFNSSASPRGRPVGSVVAGGEPSPGYSQYGGHGLPPRLPRGGTVVQRLDGIAEALERFQRHVDLRVDMIEAQLTTITDALSGQMGGAAAAAAVITAVAAAAAAAPIDRKRRRSADREVVDLTADTPSPRRRVVFDISSDGSSSWSGSSFSDGSSLSSSGSEHSNRFLDYLPRQWNTANTAILISSDHDSPWSSSSSDNEPSPPSKKPKPSPKPSPSRKTPPKRPVPKTPRKPAPRRPSPRTPSNQVDLTSLSPPPAPRKGKGRAPSQSPTPLAPRTPPQQKTPAVPSPPPAPRKGKGRASSQSPTPKAPRRSARVSKPTPKKG